jgi:flavorubredoxin
MAFSNKYGRINIPGIGEDEPVFILRAQDKLAIWTIEMYRILCESHGAKVSETLGGIIEAFKNWSGPKKLPD